MCENKECGRGLGRDLKRARERLVRAVRPLGAWPVREVRVALQVGYGGREPDVESCWPAANIFERLRFEVESRRSIENGVPAHARTRDLNIASWVQYVGTWFGAVGWAVRGGNLQTFGFS